MYRLGGRSKIAVETEELLRIVHSQNPNFEFASQYLTLFFQPSDYYGILGLDSTKKITEKDVKSAFKRQAKIYHPDKNPDDPFKEEKEQRFKLLIEAKDALLKKLRSGKEPVSGFREGASLASYLGNISKLFEGYVAEEKDIIQDQEEINGLKRPIYPEDEESQDIHGEQEETKMEIEGSASIDEYLGPYFEEIRILESMMDGWAGKEVLIVGAGREPVDFSMPVILAQMGAKVSAIDINYRGPSEYKGCQYYRISADRLDQIFAEEQFDVVISTEMFGAPFTNWAIKQYALNPFKEGFKDRIRELELEILGGLVKLTKKGGLHFHYNKDLNPQSWNFNEDDLKHIGYESAFRPQNLQNFPRIWFLKR